jgi:hypothetical protein
MFPCLFILIQQLHLRRNDDRKFCVIDILNKINIGIKVIISVRNMKTVPNNTRIAMKFCNIRSGVTNNKSITTVNSMAI